MLDKKTKKYHKTKLESYLTGVLFFLILFSGFLLCQSAKAATYYSDFSTGSDSNNGTSTSTPWKFAPGMTGCASNCLSHTPTSGDVYVLKGGVTWPYSSVSDIWTLPTSGITVQGGQQLGTPWGTGLPVIASDDTTGGVTGIIVGNHSNVTIDGIKIYKTESVDGGSGIAIGAGSYIEIKNCVLDQTGDQSIRGVGVGSAHILIHDNTFSNVGRMFIAVGDGTNVDDIQIYNNTFLGPGYWVGGSAGSRCTAVGTPNTCCLYDSSTLAHQAANATACENRFGAGCTSTGSPSSCCLYDNDSDAHIVANAQACAAHGDGMMIGSECTTANTCLTNLSIHHNIFKGDWAQGATALIFLQNGAVAGASAYGGNHVQIYDNQTAIDSDGALNAYIYLWAIWNDVKIYNNTTGGWQGGSSPVSSCIAITHASTNVDIKNNILSGCINGITGDSGLITADYNFYNLAGGEILRWINSAIDCRNRTDCTAAGFEARGLPASGVSGDPKFITAPTGSNSGNWHLQSSSPARTGGANLGSPYTTDLDGVVGTGRIGAYEYVSGSTDTTPPAAPSGLSVN